MILSHHGKSPQIHPSVFIAPSADVIGETQIGEDSSVWFQCVIRGDVNTINIGSRTNIQDHTMIHVTRKSHPTFIGDDVTVGHRAMIHGCRINDRVLIGMGAILLDGCEIGEDSVVGAGALVTQGKKFPPKSLIVGSPAKVVRELNEKELSFLKVSASNYVNDAKEYLEQLSREE